MPKKSNIPKVKLRKRQWRKGFPLRYYAEWHDGARWRSEALNVDNAIAAAEAVDEIQSMLGDGIDPGMRTLSLQGWIDGYHAWCKGRKADGTIARERRALKTWLSWLQAEFPAVRTPRQLRPEHIERYQTARLNALRLRPAKKAAAPETFKAPDGREVAPRTVNLELVVIKYLVKNYSMRASVRILNEDITAGIKPVREAKPATRAIAQGDLDEVERRLLAGHRTKKYHALAFRILRETGMRGGECFGLRWKDVDFDRGHLIIDNSEVHVVKTRETRRVGMSPQVAERLRALGVGKPDAPIFPGPPGKGFMNRFRLVLHRTCLAAEIKPFGMHALRHTAATKMLDAGMPSHWVQGVLGHKHLSTTERYIHHTQQGADQAVAMLWKEPPPVNTPTPPPATANDSAASTAPKESMGNVIPMFGGSRRRR